MMNKENIKDVLIDQHARRQLKRFVNRSIYTQFEAHKQSDHIVIISGLRRSGKSTLLEHIRGDNIEKDFYLNFDDDRLVQFKLEDFQSLYELFVEMYGAQKTFYFDEIQNIPGWERFTRRLHDEGNKIYITGSNASMLSAELGTRLTGRYIEVRLYPFSFEEFLEFNHKKDLITANLTTIQKGLLKSEFNEFMLKGGLPEYLVSGQVEYLHAVYESILYRDIIVRHKIGHPNALKELVYHLASNVGKECSYNSLRKILGIASPSTISDYCAHLEDSFLCFLINRFDYSLKKQTMSPKKIYFIDQALAVKIGFRFSEDKGRLLENIVFLQLKRKGVEIFYHQKTKECDFIVRQGAEIIAAIQVCVHLDDPKTKERELAGLNEAMTQYNLPTGLIITLDTIGQEDNIQIMPIWRWLLT